MGAVERFDRFRREVPGFGAAQLVALGPRPAPSRAGGPPFTPTLSELLHPEHRGLLVPSRAVTLELAARWRIGEAAGALAALAALDGVAPHRFDATRLAHWLQRPLPPGQRP